jgi:Transposase Tn5 dimerisation domain
LHPTYAVTPERVPLGVLDAWMWAREPKDAQGQRGGLKESLRWIEGYERVAETASSLPHTRLVYVADREADMLALMERAQELGTPADWLIRSTHDRALPEGAKLWTATTEGAPLGEIAFTMGSRHGVKARQVRQHVWLRRIELPAGVGQSVAATCLVAREFDAPGGVKPIEWRLLTNREATTLQEAIELIDWYRARWEIEILFNVLKNGCRVEALQLGAIERLERALALFLVVAWRIVHLMHMGRSCPDLDAELFFDADEIRGAYLLTDVKQPATPKLNEVLRLIARLGGFLGRKSDGEPGAKAIWLGLKEVHVAAKTLQKLRAGGHAGNCV